MSATPEPILKFLEGRRIAVTGVARDGRLPANAIYRRLKACGYDVVPINPRASEVEAAACYPDLRSVPGGLDAVMIASPPASGPEIVRQALERGVRRIWFHRSFGEGSVAEEAVRACRNAGVEPIVGGCPLMFCGKVDVFHRCMAWWLQRRGRVPR
jgi:predicted CoA-binding protein